MGPQSRLERTCAILRDGIKTGLHLGAQLYVTLHGRNVVDLGIGESRPGEAMTEDAIMLWFSSVKPVAAVAIGQLWERGKLDLDDRIAKFIPEFGMKGKEPITLRHALTHTGGFRTGVPNWGTETWEQTICLICERPLEPGWIIGRTAGYHQVTAWYILGELIRRVDGRTYDRYVRDEIFLPLAMNDSWVGMPAEKLREYGNRFVPMYQTSKGELEANWIGNSAEGTVMPRPAGNGRGPIRELARFYEMLLAKGSLDGARILSPQTIEAGVARHRVGLLDKTFEHVIDWGLGFILNSNQYGMETLPYGYGGHASPRTFGHSGSQSSCAFADPEHELVVAWACNGMPGEPKHQSRQRAINTAIYEDLGLG
jgi:CubicO group peptidase (beta-lactamase class C family)